MVQAIALLYDWKRRSWDVDTAYLQSDEEFCTAIAMLYPKGWQMTALKGDGLKPPQPITTGCARRMTIVLVILW